MTQKHQEHLEVQCTSDISAQSQEAEFSDLSTFTNVTMVTTTAVHMGLKHASREKKCSMVNFLIFVHKIVYRIRFQMIKIGPLKGFEKNAFFSLLRRIRGLFVFRGGPRFSFRALEVPEPRVRKRP